MALAGLAGLTGVAVAVQTATRGVSLPRFRVSVAPVRQLLVPGQRARYSVTVERTGELAAPVRLRVSGLPRRAQASFRLAGGASIASVPAGQTGATLTVKTAAGTPAGLWRPRLVATAGGTTRSRRLVLRITPARFGLFRLFTRPVRQLTTPGSSASFTVFVKRRPGFRRPVRLSIGLPPAWRASLARRRVTGRARLRVTPPADVTRGAAGIVISGSVRWRGRTVRRHQVAVLKVSEPHPFRISGNLATPLVPGLRAPLDLELTNPHRFPIRLTRLSVALRDPTSKPGCSGSANYGVDQYSGPYPLTLQPGAQALSDLVTQPRLWPQIGMRDLAVSQDVCKRAQLALDYDGTAVR